jgi:hypothetical protein
VLLGRRRTLPAGALSPLPFCISGSEEAKFVAIAFLLGSSLGESCSSRGGIIGCAKEVDLASSTRFEAASYVEDMIAFVVTLFFLGEVESFVLLIEIQILSLNEETGVVLSAQMMNCISTWKE